MGKSKCEQPCSACPWQSANQGKRHQHGFYTKTNITRLWNQLRRGGAAQSCHPTDPNHPDHNAPANSKPRECPGSVILILRELETMLSPKRVLTGDLLEAYLKRRRKGLTRRGILYWAVDRIKLARVPLGNGPLPHVDITDSRIALPAYLQE